MDWDEIEKYCGKRPSGNDLFADAWWASRVENYFRIKRMKLIKMDGMQKLLEDFLLLLETVEQRKNECPISAEIANLIVKISI